MKQHYQYEPGDQIQDLTFDPPQNGVIVAKHQTPDVYYVRINGATNNVVIHARKLQMAK
jgi:cytochrome b involved in lipid metabolism